MGNLQQNSHAVSRLAFGVFAGPVFQFFHNTQSVIHCLPCLFSFDIHHQADPAGIVFEIGAVQRFLSHVDHPLHAKYHSGGLHHPGSRIHALFLK
ncbi:hypothetical protein SDC9_99893 [bioreactor metagenome]|uniref:Uncharacterized protein n=1 Tax=bioreactor metagenome TaxID=1076179 RepID=A0A645AK70_9ZZZZ